MLLYRSIGAAEPEKCCVNNSWTSQFMPEISFKMMDRPFGMERQKFPFTIENILSKYPNGDGDRRPCGTSGSGLKERPVSPVGVHAETVHRACLCCCYCSHCGDVFQAEFIHEGKTKPNPLCEESRAF